jgi:molybdenum cofactor guanylyltransferase
LDVSCIILAGGKSIRLGRNKVVEKIGNQSLIERVVASLASLNSDLIVVATEESIIPQLTNFPRLKRVNDVFPGRGSLGGVYTGLTASKTLFNLVVACDMPFLNMNLLNYMIGLAEGYDVVIPKTKNDILEPLHAVYSKNCISPIELLIKKNRFSILELFPLVKVRFVETAEVERFDPEHLSFFNINTEADLTAGRERLRRET